MNVSPRGLDNNAIEQLLKYGAFSQKQSVLASVYWSSYSLPHELRLGSVLILLVTLLTVPSFLCRSETRAGDCPQLYCEVHHL